MTNETLIVVILAAVAVIAVVMFLLMRRRLHLKERFGPEYTRTVRETGDARRAEAILAEREQRVSRYSIRPLTSEQGSRFMEAWRRLQALFVDDPAAAVSEADGLLTEMMETRGYPMTDFNRRAEDLSVDHPRVISQYREAHEIAVRHSRQGASTEDLRQAIVHYRALFEELLQRREPKGTRA